MRMPMTVALFLAMASQQAIAGTPSTVAISVDTSALAPKMAVEVQDGAATHVLSGLGQVMSTLAGTDITLTPVSDPIALEQDLECESIECLQALAETAKVDLVVQVRVRLRQSVKKPSRRAKPDYLVSMIVVRSVPGREAWSEKTDCNGCGPSEIKHTASLLASTIAERIKFIKTPAAPVAEAEPAPVPVTVAPPTPPPPALERRPLPAAPTPEPQWYIPTYLSLTAIAGGVLLIGSGIYLVHINGQGTCDLAAPKDLCARRYKTETAGIGLMAGGGLATLAGVVGLIAFSPHAGSSHMALNITGSSLVLSGGF
jgi:hypothetical protein